MEGDRGDRDIWPLCFCGRFATSFLRILLVYHDSIFQHIPPKNLFDLLMAWKRATILYKMEEDPTEQSLMKDFYSTNF